MAFRVVSSAVVGIVSGIVPPSDLPSQYLTDDVRFFTTFYQRFGQMGDECDVCPIDACQNALQSPKLKAVGGGENSDMDYRCGQCLTDVFHNYDGTSPRWAQRAHFCSEDGTTIYIQEYEDQGCTKPSSHEERALVPKKEECHDDQCFQADPSYPTTPWVRQAFVGRWEEIGVHQVVAPSASEVEVQRENYNCPGSGAFVHAWMEVTVETDAACEVVQAEMEARANGSWVDPHNGGIYSVLSSSNGQYSTTHPGVLNTQRTTNPATAVGGALYTDKQTFELRTICRTGGCQIKGCSESQGSSVGDFSTNYCDMLNLYCGASDGCVQAQNDFTHQEKSHKGSLGAGHDASKCIVAPSVSV